MNDALIVLITGAMAFVVSLVAFPQALRFAITHGIVDNPNARKLQRVPVPVMGGIAVYAGVLLAACFICGVTKEWELGINVVAMTIMLVIGMWDDIKNLPAIFRFIVEIALIWGLMALTGNYIDSLHGLWGVYELDVFIALPLSLIGGVGIINAVNLIDGVDGYSSSYGILANTLFAILFFSVGDVALGLLAVACACACVPFFFHNVFGKKTKMFFGDGGTLMLGTLMAVFVFAALSHESLCNPLEEKGVGIVAFVLAVLAIPVFDTLRVMSARIVRGKSPFHPDKTHLHHLFIEMKFSHLGTSFAILMIQLSIVLIWLASWLLGASAEIQLYIVLVLGIGTTFVFYKFMKVQQSGGPKDKDGITQGTKVWELMCKVGRNTRYGRDGLWLFLERLADWRWK